MNAGNLYLSRNKPVQDPTQQLFSAAGYWLRVSGASLYREDEQAVMILYGYIYNADFNTDPAFWLELLQQTTPTLTHELNRLDGAYNLVLFNKADGRCSVFTDRLGGQRLYYHQNNTELWLSTEFSVIADLLPTKNFDTNGVMETLHFRWLTGTDTAVKNVKKMPHAAVMQLSLSHSPVTIMRFGLLPAKVKQTSKSMAEHVEHVQQLIADNIVASITPGDKIAVLLSGGVDSAVLLAICCYLQLDVVAITPVHEHHDNPELETAKAFAREMGVEHRVIPIQNADITQLFSEVVQQLASAPRSHSALSLQLLVKQLSGEFNKVLYGEGADTLFGSRAVKRFGNRYNKHRAVRKVLNWLPGVNTVIPLLPIGTKVKALVNFDTNTAIAEEIALTLSEDIYSSLANTLTLQPKTLLQQFNTDVALLDGFDANVRMLKQSLFSTDVVNHFYELYTLASAAKIQLVSPFACWPVMSYAAQLPDALYFGEQFVKPVLRALGEKFYTAELMYLPKFGFPVPHKYWLSEPLKPLTQQAAEFFNVPNSWLDNAEMAWTLAGLYLLAKQWHISPLPLMKHVAGAVRN